MYKGFALSILGYSHEHCDNPKDIEDASRCVLTDDYAIVAVADGHGGDKYFRSGYGSKIAVDSAITKLEEFLKNEEYIAMLLNPNITTKKTEEIFTQIEKSILSLWNEKILLDFNSISLDQYKNLKIDNTEFNSYYYGTTLLFGCLSKNFSYISQIGDGQITIFNSDLVIQNPIKKDEKINFGLTTSLCDLDAINEFHHKFYKNNINAIVLGTDGLVDSFSEKTYFHVIKTAIYNHQLNEKLTYDSLKQWLPKVSEKGSRDDISFGIIYRS